jgi:hypothetical protein
MGLFEPPKFTARKFAAFLASSLGLVLYPNTLSGQIRTLNKATGELSMGGRSTQIGATCITFVALLSADDFFLRLRLKETPHGLEYWNGSEQVTRFPPDLTVTILTYLASCGHSETTSPRPPETILRGLHWTVAWKTGMKIHSPTQIEVTQTESAPDELERRIGTPMSTTNATPPSKPMVPWTVSLKLHHQDALLSDSLIVTATTSTGKQVARFSGHL